MEERIGATNQVLDSGVLSQNLGGPATSENLSRDVCLKLASLMTDVTKEVTASSVNAACNCAAQIHKLLTLNFQMKKSTKPAEPSAQKPFFKQVQETEETLIKNALESSKGNVTQAAQMMSMNRTTLVEKIKKLGLRP